MNRKSSVSLLITGLHVLALIVYHYFGYLGHFGYDDLHYARIAMDINQGITDFSDHYTYRLPVVLFTALSFKIFGITDTAASLPPLIVTLLILVVVALVLYRKNNLTLSAALSLTLFSGWFIFYSDKIMPDIYVAFAIFLALFIIHRFKYVSQKNAPSHAILLSVTLLFGFMAKETVVLVIPLFAYLILYDLLLKRDLRFWIWFIGSGVVILFSYFLAIHLVTGNAAGRFEAITANSYLNLCSYDKQPVKILLERISYGFFRMMTFQGMMTSAILILFFLTTHSFRSLKRFDDSFSFWAISALILFLSSNFMTISVNSYSPMCLDPRHYLFLIPVAAIPASIILTEKITRRKDLFVAGALFSLFALFSYFFPGKSFLHLYLPLSLLFLMSGIFVLAKGTAQKVFLVLFIIILMITPGNSVKYALKTKFTRQREIVEKEILDKFDDAIVVTNEVQKRLGNHYKRARNSTVTFLSYNEFNPDSIYPEKVLLFKNWYTQYLSGLQNEDLPYYAREIHPGNRKIFEDSTMQIGIYALLVRTTPESGGTLLIRTYQDFENSVSGWDINGNPLDSVIRYEGHNALRTNEFSSVFSVPADTLLTERFNQIVISTRFFYQVDSPTKAVLVISFNDETGSYIWKGLEINRFIKAYSNWWPVEHEIILDTREIKKGSVMTIYIWNMDRDLAYIDNFDIKITGIGS